MDHDTLKKSLRKSLLADRKALPHAQVVTLSEAIFDHWKKQFGNIKFDYVHLFQTMQSRNEVETSFFEDFFRKQNPAPKIVIPIVDTVTDRLRHVHLTDDIELVKNKFGVPEPVMPMQFVAPEKIDLILVPLLGFDTSGNRLGYGKGHYDRFLHLTRPESLKIGLAFELSKQESLPAQPHDFPLDFVVTEAGIYPFQPNPRV